MKVKKWSRDSYEIVLTIVSFVYYWIMALYKLTTAPIWQDEAMEFFCSLPVRGEIRGVTKFATMYERMAYIQQQPPLYNWVMSLWLRISEDEWWYRFSSAAMGFVAAIGIYYVIRKLCNRSMAAFCVIIYSSIYTIMYYIKEASEYSMLIMFLIWLIYAYILLYEEVTLKRVVAFTLLCVASIYTHYGAAFAVLPMAVNILIVVLKTHDFVKIRNSIIVFATAVIVGGGPLFYFFLLPQFTSHESELMSKPDIIIEKGSIFGDFLNSLMCVFRWFAIDFDRDWEKLWLLICVAMVVLAAMIIYVTVKSDQKCIRGFLYSNIAIYLIYYTITKLNIYAYGWYGNRYNMFLFPFWFVIVAFTLFEFVHILKNSKKEIVAKGAKFLQIAFIAAGILYCVYGDYRISNHWDKMDLRTVVSEWYADDGYEIPTVLDFHQRYGFVYYFTHHDKYDESQWENIVYNDEVDTGNKGDDTPEIWKDYLHHVYGEKLPDELYLVTGQWNAFVDAFVELGYEVEPVVDTTAKLYKMTKK